MATRIDFRRFIAEELHLRARNTVRTRVFACRSFFKYLRLERISASDVAGGGGDPTDSVSVSHEETEPEEPFSPVELRALIAAAESPRDRVLMLFLLSSGCRRGEAARLLITDIDWSRGRVVLRGKGAKRRWTQPGVATMTQMRAFIGGRESGPVWLSRYGNALSGPRIYEAVEHAADIAGVAHAHPHRFRTTFAVRFLHEYGDLKALKEILGHKKIETTEKYAAYGYILKALELQDGLDLGAELAG